MNVWPRSLQVWEILSGRVLMVLKGHTKQVNAHTFSPSSRVAISASADGHIKLWDLRSGACLQTLIGHSDAVTGAAFSPDGRFAISSSLDCTIKVRTSVVSNTALGLTLAHAMHMRTCL